MISIAVRQARLSDFKVKISVTAAAAALTLFVFVDVLTTIPDLLSQARADGLWWRIAGAAVLYLISQALRGLRLAYILSDVSVSLRRLIEVNFVTQAASLGIPYKIGELYRVFELGVLTQHWPRALVAVWIERGADSTVIAIIIAVALSYGTAGQATVLPLLLLLIVFIVTSLVVFLVVPQNIGRLKHFVIRRYQSMNAVAFLRFADIVDKALSQAPRLLERKYVTLLFVTACIWMAELLALCAIVPRLVREPVQLATALGGFLAGIATGASLAGPLQAGPFGGIADVGGMSGGAAAAEYRVATAVPLLLFGLAAYGRYIVFRIKSVRFATGRGRRGVVGRAM
jgi:hypothetical protein